MDYNHNIKIHGKEIKFRKWKVKDKKNFVKAMKSGNADEINNIVFDCLEDRNIPLSEDEMKYILLHIRSVSLGSELSFNIDCMYCEKPYVYSGNIFDIMKPSWEDYGKIKVGDVQFDMGEIPNKEYYDDSINQCNTPEEKHFIDFLYHVKKLNGSDAFTFDSLFEYVNNLDLDIGEVVFNQWEQMRLSFNNVVDIKCPHCEEINAVEFDQLHGFFPEEWFK